jgi:hypothetical protein
VAYGYRESESGKVPEFDGKDFVDSAGNHIEMADTFSLKRMKITDADTRPVVGCSLGVHIQNAALPHVDSSDTRTALTGAMYRFCRKIPNSGISKPGFRAFVDNWLCKNMKPLSPDLDTSFEYWIERTPYSQARKLELTMKWIEMKSRGKTMDPNLAGCKSFVKDECYNTFKHARAINSRSDQFKCQTGPIFQLISDELFKLPWFIKKIPVRDRPQYIIDRCYRTGQWYLTSDYTSFEAHFDSEVMMDCEMRLYKHMTANLAEGEDFMALLEEYFCNHENYIMFKNFTISIQAKRMSGEMCTSLGNGFSNLMFMLYLCEQNGNTEVMGVIEGDDGLFVMNGEPPKQEDFVNFGLNIKMGKVSDLNHASFCGMVFDLEDRTNITNIIEELVGFGWTTSRYARSKTGIHMSLLKAKALSMAYQYPACPVLSALAFKMCELTKSYDVRSFIKKQGTHAYNGYELQIVTEALEFYKLRHYFLKNELLQEPGENTRLLVQQLYGITIQDQIAIETYIRGMTTLHPINCPAFDKYLSVDWVYFAQYYTIDLPLTLNFNQLQLSFPQVRERAPIEQLI